MKITDVEINKVSFDDDLIELLPVDYDAEIRAKVAAAVDDAIAEAFGIPPAVLAAAQARAGELCLTPASFEEMMVSSGLIPPRPQRRPLAIDHKMLYCDHTKSWFWNVNVT